MKDRFLILQDTAGEGGFGKIDKAEDIELSREVAIKTLDPLFKDSPSNEDIERFRREAKNLAKLTHPNIPAIYDISFMPNEKDFKIYFQWINGTSLKSYIQQRGYLTLQEATKYFKFICLAISYAHKHQIIHRDLKPANIIITDDLESCYIVDFGLSLNKADYSRVTGDSAIGTPGYMSPEQENGGEVDERSDIYSLGVILYECLSGHRPRVGDYNNLSAANESIPVTLDALIKECLNPKDTRIKSVEEFLKKLTESQRPKSTLSDVLSSGSLAEIQTNLSSITVQGFNSLPVGQKRLIKARIKDLVDVNKQHLNQALSSMLCTIVPLSINDEPDFEYYYKESLRFGFEKKMTDNWIGDIQVREAVANVIKELEKNALLIVSNLIFALWERNHRESELQEKWFYHDLREVFQGILINEFCSDEIAQQIGGLLEDLNYKSHKEHLEKNSN